MTRTSKSLRRALVALPLAASLVLPGSASAASSFFGLQSWFTPHTFEWARMQHGGVAHFRMNITWSTVQPTKRDWENRQYNWKGYDAAIAAAASKNIQILPVLIGSPKWAAARPSYPPSRAARPAWRAFLRKVVQRYGRNGTFAGNKSRRFTLYQFHNEQNFPSYWTNRKPSATAYTSFLKEGRGVIRSVDKKASIVLGGMPNSRVRGTIQRDTYLAQMYRAKARGLFNYVAIQPYATSTSNLESQIKKTRAVMTKYGDRSKRVFITEVGWASSCGCKSSYVKGANGQASTLRGAFKMLKAKASTYKLSRVYWFAWRDRNLANNERDWWAPHTGLWTADGTSKPAWGAFVQFTGGRTGPSSLNQP